MKKIVDVVDLQNMKQLFYLHKPKYHTQTKGILFPKATPQDPMPRASKTGRIIQHHVRVGESDPG